MANAFNKEERIGFENVLEKFQDALVLSKQVTVSRPDSQMTERSGNTIWLPVPPIMQSFAGTDMTGNWVDNTRLAVPATIGFPRSVPFELTGAEMRDPSQANALREAAADKLASDINLAIMLIAGYQSTLVVSRPAASVGFDDVAQCEAIMNEQGVVQRYRNMALSTRDYNGMASDLANRNNMLGKKVENAWEEAYCGRVSAFDTFKLDYANRLPAATATATINGANQWYSPAATSTAITGETSNVDNRYQVLAVTVNAGLLQVGDAFTIDGVFAVHHITKVSTGQLKTFRIINIVTGQGGTGTVTISPPIISAGGGTDAELQYQNVDATPANRADLNFLNTADAYLNIFWQKDAFELLSGNYVIPENSGIDVLRATTDNKIEVMMTRQAGIDRLTCKYRFDIFFGVCCKQPEMAGIMLFSQGQP